MRAFYQMQKKTSGCHRPSSTIMANSKTGLTCCVGWILWNARMSSLEFQWPRRICWFPQQRFLNCLRWILHDMTTMSYICAGLQNSNIGHVQLHRSNAWIPWIMAAPLSFTHATISLQRQEVPSGPDPKGPGPTLVTLAKLRHLQKTTSSIWYLLKITGVYAWTYINTVFISNCTICS